jgi:hypothetical protein
LGSPKKRSILSDWRARLSADKACVYDPSARALESGYDLLSIALDAAMCQRDTGDLLGARQALWLSAELAERHARLLEQALHAMEEHSRHFGTVPAVNPLEQEHFRTEAARFRCRWDAVLHRVLFSARSRWFLKLHTLHEISTELRDTYLFSARELADGVSIAPLAEWDLLEALHDDWNTCLRETVILLKCFLTTLEPGEIKAFKHELGEKQPAEDALAGGPETAEDLSAEPLDTE